MKALTVQQPWAWAIVHGGKDVENRTQAWSYRGLLAIHAGVRESQRGMESPLVNDAWKRSVAAGSNTEIYRHAAIIGVVDLAGVHRGWSDMAPNGSGPDCCHSAWAELADPIAEREGRGVVHLMLEHPRPLRRPIPAPGRLGLWDLDGEQLAAVLGEGIIDGPVKIA